MPVSPFAIRFLAYESEIITDQLQFAKLREPNGWSVTELSEELEKLKAHAYTADNFTSTEGTFKLYEIVFPNEWDFRKAEKIAKIISEDSKGKFAFVPDGVAPEIEHEFNTHP